MDVIRSCYSTFMAFEDLGPLYKVRWYRAAADALAFPGNHSFFSFDFEDDKSNVGIGEQRPPRGVWDAGMRPSALKGDGHFQGSLDAFENGLSPGDDFSELESVVIEPESCVCGSGPFYAPPSSSPGEDFTWHATCGGLRWGESSQVPRPLREVCADCPTFPLDPLCDVPLPLQVKATFFNPSSCPNWSGYSVVLSRDPFNLCYWSGTGPNPYDGTLLYFAFWNALDFSAIPWIFEYGPNPLFFGDFQVGQDSVTINPTSVTFLTVTDSYCGPLETVSVKVEAISSP